MEKFDFVGDHVIENELVLLRPLRMEDINGLLPYSLNEPDIWQFNANGAEGEQKLRKYVETALKNRQDEREYPFVVIDKKTNTLVGCTRFYDIQPERSTIQLGFTWYGKNYQRTGINRNCKYLLLDFAFDKLKVKRVGFGANSKNVRSIQAMKNIGCTVEGVLRSNGYDANGDRIDSIVLSILKEEWQAELKDRLKSMVSTNK